MKKYVVAGISFVLANAVCMALYLLTDLGISQCAGIVHTIIFVIFLTVKKPEIKYKWSKDVQKKLDNEDKWLKSLKP